MPSRFWLGFHRPQLAARALMALPPRLRFYPFKHNLPDLSMIFLFVIDSNLAG
jgi:hypothetical protein